MGIQNILYPFNLPHPNGFYTIVTSNTPYKRPTKEEIQARKNRELKNLKTKIGRLNQENKKLNNALRNSVHVLHTKKIERLNQKNKQLNNALRNSVQNLQKYKKKVGLLSRIFKKRS
jgi:hypothetical protein